MLETCWLNTIIKPEIARPNSTRGYLFPLIKLTESLFKCTQHNSIFLYLRTWLERHRNFGYAYSVYNEGKKVVDLYGGMYYSVDYEGKKVVDLYGGNFKCMQWRMEPLSSRGSNPLGGKGRFCMSSHGHFRMDTRRLLLS